MNCLRNFVERTLHARRAFLLVLIFLGASALPVDAATFTQSGSVRSTALTGTEIDTVTSKFAQALGPRSADFDRDALPDQPFLSDSDTLNLTDFNDRSPRAIDLSAAPARTSKTLMGVGSFAPNRKVGYPETGGEGVALPVNESIFYAGDDESYIYKVSRLPNGKQRLFGVGEPENGVNAIAGPADIDGDGANELVFADGSQAVRYASSTDPIEDTFSMAYDGAGSNNNVGIGRPADFDGDGKASIPIVDGSNQIRLVGPEGIRETLITGSDDEQAAKSALTPADIDGDGSLELAYLENNNSPSEVKYVDNVGLTNDFKFLENDQGERIVADSTRGVVSQVSEPKFVTNGVIIPEPNTCFLMIGTLAGVGLTRRTKYIR